MARLTTEQYNRWHEAMKNGDEKLAKAIEAEGYGGKRGNTIEAEVIESEPTQLPSPEDIQAMRDEGMKDGEIGEQFGVSRQKISAIMKIGE